MYTFHETKYLPILYALSVILSRMPDAIQIKRADHEFPWSLAY
jgi:hypothetical protein